MNPTSYEKEAPVLSRDEAIAILNTPDEELEALIDRASSLRYKYKGNRVSIHILTNARSGNCSQDCAYCAHIPSIRTKIGFSVIIPFFNLSPHLFIFNYPPKMRFCNSR